MKLQDLILPGRRRLPLILQTEAAECGIACLGMVAGYHGYHVDLGSLRRRWDVSLKGASMGHLVDIADQLKLRCRPVKLSLNELTDLKRPAILHWKMQHFVVLRQIRKRFIVVHDPALGECKLSWSEVGKFFTGIALEVWPAAEFSPAKLTRRMKFTDFWSRIDGLKRNLVYLLLLSLLLQGFVLAGPFYLQLVVDRALVNADRNLLAVLAVGFALLLLFRMLISMFRSRLLLMFSSLMSFQMASNLFNHLLRLPLAWFQRRHVGDVLSRFSSVEQIRALFSEGLIAILVDGFMALTTAAMMLYYDELLGLLVMLAVLLYGVVRFALFPAMRNRSHEKIAAEAREQSSFIETVRGIQSIKIFARENLRHVSWLDRQAEVVNSGIALGRLGIVFQACGLLIFGLENILVIFFAATKVLQGHFSIGMLMAFIAYKSQFTERLSTLIEKLIEIRMLGLHLERLSDIGLSERECLRPPSGRKLKGTICLRGVGYRYASTEPMLFSNLDLQISKGEFVALIGPSGSGKTTLLKVIMGLLPSSQGKMYIDDSPLGEGGLMNYRRASTAVMQDDSLLAGSVAENISFFDESLDMARVRYAAKLSGLHGEINAMPMGYETLIGDMGTSLSGGQRQRLLLARALYPQPLFLFIDEVTAHLDCGTASQVQSVIRRLTSTRVVVTHDLKFAGSADRCFRLQDGHLNLLEPRPTRDA